ncbi:MAG TPA: hypothetical protein VMF32_11785 [Xanthobacteraceae bacterium]|nr:hypothetical protein [Xanthobacteraceae bacterium]
MTVIVVSKLGVVAPRQAAEPPTWQGGKPPLHPPVPPAAPKRPKRRRGHIDHFRTDDTEHAKLERRARAAGLSVGAYCRACCLGAAGPRARRRPPVEHELLAHNTAALNHIGSNLNQTTRALNEIALGDGSGRLAQVAHLVEPIQTTLAELRRALADNRRALGYG